MMQVSFDLISDLHVETWDDPFDWTGQATSMIAVVAGDISRDRNVVRETLAHLGQCYRAVLYIDGNDEHRYNLHDLQESYNTLSEQIGNIENVIYLRNNVVVIDGVAFLGTNTWWTFDFDTPEVYDFSKEWFWNQYKVEPESTSQIEAVAMQDASYMCNSVKRLQTHKDVKQIVMITHTVPDPLLLAHDLELEGSHKLNCSGNSHILKSFAEDTENKINTWCFGHYHGDIDSTVEGVRFVNNCRGRGNTEWSKSVYHPKKISVTVNID